MSVQATQLQIQALETNSTIPPGSPDMRIKKASTESDPLQGMESSPKNSSDPESLKHSEVKESPSEQAKQSNQVEMTPEQLRKFKIDGVRTVIGGVLMHLVLGTFYLWGSVSLYVASFLRHYDSSIDINLVKLVYPLMLFAINFAMPFGVRLSQRFGSKLVCIIAMAVIVISVFVSGFITNFGGLVVMYGIMFGFGNGIIYMIPVSCGWKYFPHRKGMVSGAIIGGFGFGTFIFNYVALAIVNPDNEAATVASEDGTKYFTADISYKVPEMFKILAGCYLVVGMLGAFLVTSPKVLPSNYPEVRVTQSRQTGGQPCQQPQNQIDTLEEGLKSLTYWILLFITAFSSFYGLMLSNNYKVYGMTTIADDLFLTTVGSVGSAFNGIARFIWSSLLDKFGYKRVFFFLLVVQAIICGTFVSISHIKALYLIWYIISMSCEGGCLSMQPTITAKVFGPKKSSLIYAFVYFGFSVANLAAFFLTKYGQKTLGWKNMFWVTLGISLVPLILIVIFNEYPVWKKKETAKCTPTATVKPEKK